MPLILPNFVEVDVNNPDTYQDFNCVQIKFDGWFTETTCTEEGLLLLRSKTDRFLRRLGGTMGSYKLTAVQGEYMFGTQEAVNSPLKGLIICYDLSMLQGAFQTQTPYIERFKAMTKVVRAWGVSEFRLINNYAIAQLDELVQKVTKENLEGLVFRNLTDPTKPLGRWKQKVTARAQIVGFVAGEGKLENSLGAVKVRFENGAEGTVGGFDHELGFLIWSDQETYKGKWIEVEGRKQFESGKLRHPNFVRFESGQL